MVTGVVVCKYLAATLFQKTMKFTLNERDLIFGLSVNQAAATLAAVIVGFRIGLFDEAVLSGTIMMILATCLVGPWFTERSGLKIASQKVKSPERAYRGEERVMVAMGRRESVEMLTGVALSLRGSSSKEPVFPLFVAQDGVDVDKRIAFGENILSVAVAHAVSADVPVSPISRIDINVAGGILHATKEWHIDTLVMGSIPSPEVNFRSLLFGVYDKVCDDSDLLILMCRTAHPMSLDKNIFVVVPPMLECQPGFARAFRALKNIAYGNKLQLRVVGTENTIRQLEKTPQKKGPGAEVAYITIGKFKDVDPYLSDNIAAKSDVIVIMAAKKGRLAWHPSLRNLVHDLGHKFPGNNIIMAHPSDRGGQEEEMPLTCAIAGTDTPGSDVSIRVEIKEKTPESFIKSLLEKKFPPGSLILAESMKSLRPFEPIALTPEIMLLHTHSGYLDAPVILLGIHREGIVFSGSPKSAHALFLLVSPKDATSVHLTALMGVARMAQELQKERPWADLK